MKVVNYNDELRDKITNEVNKMGKISLEESGYAIYDLYDRVKSNCGIYDYVLGLLFETRYLISSFFKSKYPKDEELAKDYLELTLYNNFNDIKKNISLEDFTSYLGDCYFFSKLENDIKKEIIKNAFMDKDYLVKIFPGFLNDVFFYLNNYDTSCIIDNYNQRVECGDEKAYLNSISENVNKLIDLKENDYNAYVYNILEMSEDFYIYKQYILSSKKCVDKNDEKIIGMIESDLDDFILASNNQIVLRLLLDGYLKYNLLSENAKQKIKKYNDENNKQKINDVLQKSYKLKNEKNR